MEAFFKLRITNLGESTPPYFEFTYGDRAFANPTSIRFEFVENRTGAFQAVIGPNLNQALKDAMDLDLAPSGEWQIDIDPYYITVTSLVENRAFYPSFRTSFGLVYTGEVNNGASGGDGSEIEFIQTLPGNALLNAFNDNVIRFRANGIDKMTLDANEDLEIKLYPDPTGEYYLNLKDFATVMINQNKFADEIVPDIEASGYVYEDPTLFLKLDLDFSAINFNSAATYYFLKSVSQIANYFEKQVNESYILLPKHGLSHKVTYYEGYPFDVPVFSNAIQDVLIKNKTTGHDVQLSFQQNTNRLFFSQGSENFTIEDVMPLQTGMNRLELSFGNKKIDLILNKKESVCAPYFKFYRNSGGWGYIRFLPEVAITDKTKDGKDVRVDFNGIQNTLTRILNEGKETTVELEMYTELLEPWEMENFKDFQKSPRVEMYVSDLFQKQTSKSWIGVQVKSSSLETTKRKTQKNRERVKIEFTEYNLHL
ncbi:hypothetical protein [uncultured Christiangramia sp.]|uniref:hypothetical protein n=1 Tax=uncultured Christiangramia sp. TaxID=503836 RepID=UPI002624CB6B|nr:hypothetical protein [uncultured Christiangramia sp.]